MRVFLTGATGFIGSAIIPELLGAGHTVLGLTRSEAGAAKLKASGAEPHLGSLEDPGSLRGGAAEADGVIHCAFDHDFSDFLKMCEKERVAVEALGDALAGSSNPLIITSGVGLGLHASGEPASEDFFDVDHANPRKVSEVTAAGVAERGVNVSVVRLPQVHDTHKQGLITYAIQVAREKKLSAYIGEGLNRWSAAHVSDVARLYRFALEKQQPGSRYNAVAEEGITMKAVAEVIANGLDVPVASLSPDQSQAHFGWLAMFAAMDLPASSALTRQRLNWHPTGPGLIADLKAMDYNT